ncbi:isochorismate synthase [Nodularia harveyana UHCC-0300]|uniref:Isochorismate synthase MenF n=1 Tax=Nodularia harveyana UHCC-0300 TaxID=2974287 RepID=A0ABU5UA38_9CYAN|nr:isochorismate synthase [Nodularia harveyana]MEA5580384.1 isochorismate synthase [Nodularia harveyana UHCC-0300]
MIYSHDKGYSKYQIQLSQKIKKISKSIITSSINHHKIIRIEVKIDNNIEPLQWLLQQQNSSKTYWSDREHRFEMAGVGEADVEFGQNSIEYSKFFPKLKSRLSSSYKNLRYYGGISFNQNRQREQNWQQFGNYRFVVPKFEIYAEKDETYLACNFLLKDSQNYRLQLNQLLSELKNLVFDQPSHPISLPTLISRTNLPNQSDWNRNVNAALTSFTQGDTTKIVLARKSIFEFNDKIEPLNLLLFLKKNNPHLFHFCFQPSLGNAFIGASPERLYNRTERLLQTEALAGTRPRGNSLEEDQNLSQELLTSEKDIREHQLVIHTLRKVLHQLCHSIGKPRDPVLLKLNKVQHLYTPCNGILLEDFSDVEILPQLNPTPAVGGYPREQALMAINELEPFDRGWYAAPVGSIGHNSAEFAVAIRSGLVQNNQLSLFSGSGIVEGSQPEAEWQEIENKLGTFIHMIDCLSKDKQ